MPELPSTVGKPITPEEALKEQPRTIPPQVYEAFNFFLRTRITSYVINIIQNEVVSSILSRMPGTRRQELFDNHWLDIEDAYRDAGWRVSYFKPSCDEDGEAFWSFNFERKKDK